MGWREYEPIAQKYKVPIVPTVFESVDLLEGIYLIIKQLEEGRHEVENQYLRSVKKEGNREAQNIVYSVFEITDRKWRGVGEISQSGLQIKPKYKRFDAEEKFDVKAIKSEESPLCMSGEVLQGNKKPNECPAFGKECAPSRPLGATMVSSEGACSAYYKYHRIV